MPKMTVVLKAQQDVNKELHVEISFGDWGFSPVKLAIQFEDGSGQYIYIDPRELRKLLELI